MGLGSVYIKSPFFTAVPNGNTVKLKHIVTQRDVVVPRGVLTLLEDLKEGKGREDILRELCALSGRANEEESFVRLETVGLLLPTDYHLRNHFLTPATHSIFGLQAASVAMQNKLVFLGIPFCGGNGLHRGCASFPTEVRRLTNGLDLSSDSETISMMPIDGTAGDAGLHRLLRAEKIVDAGDLFINAFEDREVVFANIRSMIRSVLENGNLPMSLGGDHSIAYPIIQTFTERYGNIQIIQFDAHTDCYTNASHISQSNVSIIHHGNFMGELLKSDRIAAVIQIGIRGQVNLRQFKRTHSRQTVYAANEVPRLLQEAVDIGIDPGLPTYITFDIDFIDPAFAPGTSTPVPGGPTVQETVALLRKIVGPLRHLIGVDFVEVNSALDKANASVAIAAELILTILNSIHDPYTGDAA